MNIVRVLSAVAATGFLILGYLMSAKSEQAAGHSLFIGGAIILAAVIISLAIVENKRK